VNFYKHHLGDYDGATAHLSWDEDMAYTRLLRAYYRREQPIPVDGAHRLVRAVSKAQKSAVDAVLAEFFSQQADGWHNKRADAEIAAYQEQANTNRRIAQGRKRERIVDEPLTNRTPATSSERTPNQEPEPDTRTNNQKEQERTPSAKRAPRRVAKTSLPPDFCLSDRLKAWAEEHEFSNLETHLEHFVGKARANGYAYADWDQALMNAIRENWAGVGIKSNGGRNGAENLWRMSDAGIEAKGRELGMMARGGESYRDYAARIAQQMEAGQ